MAETKKFQEIEMNKKADDHQNEGGEPQTLAVEVPDDKVNDQAEVIPDSARPLNNSSEAEKPGQNKVGHEEQNEVFDE